MKAALISIWLCIGLAGLIFHYGPGQELKKFDAANHQLGEARRLVELEDWGGAIQSYENAIAELPEASEDLVMQLRLEKAKAYLMNEQLPEARLGLESLLDELEQSGQSDSDLGANTRLALAKSQYYVTWLMRLEGLPQTEWEPEIEACRQNYRLLAERALETGDSTEQGLRLEDVESAVRLARIDLSELQALPLPCECKGCKSGDCKGKGKKKGKRPGKGQKPNEGAGGGDPGELYGS